MPEIKIHPFRGRWAAVGTMHDKERAIAPPLCRWFDMTVTKAPGVDTDALGTFTGEIARKGTIIDAARQKAKWAIARTGAPIGIGSEGSFGPDPFVPFVTSGLEVLLLHDAASGQEIVMQKQTKTNFAHMIVGDPDRLDEFLLRIGFPEHAVIVRPEEARDNSLIHKGLQNREAVAEAVRIVAARNGTSRIIIETDMRAHLNPTRMAAIERTARWLALKTARCCPNCRYPGFGTVDVVRGVPCGGCRTPTRQIKAEVFGCQACGYRIDRRVRSGNLRSDPQWCEFCNP